jgi:predicted transposase YbfD/YdcC
MVAGASTLVSSFADMTDPRIDRTKRHLLVDIVCLAICAVIAGADGWEDIEEFGKVREAWLRKFLRLPHGIPSHDTINRVFRAVKPSEFERCFLTWVQSLHEQLGFRHVAIDGKTLRRSHDRRGMKSALHLVCAWCVENHVVMGQQAVDGKSNEITAIPELLKLLELKGALITIDAMGCQKGIAQQIVEGGGDYVLAVKDNQPKLHEALQEQFIELHESGAESGRGYHVTGEKSHGRQELRHYYTMPIPPKLAAQLASWKGCRSLGQVITHVTRDGKEEVSEVRYYISTLPSNARRFAAAVRGHWGIENSLHWVLDVTFDEDRSRIRKDHGADNFALLRRIAISLIKRDTSRGSVRRKRKRAAWSERGLETILQAMV